MCNNKMLVQRSSPLSLSISVEGICFLIIIIQLNVFLTPSGSREVEMPLLFVAHLAFVFIPFAALPEVLNKPVGALRTNELFQCLFS